MFRQRSLSLGRMHLLDCGGKRGTAVPVRDAALDWMVRQGTSSRAFVGERSQSAVAALAAV